MNPPEQTPARSHLARQAREQFVANVSTVLAGISAGVGERLLQCIDQSGSSKEAQLRRDAMMAFQQLSGDWTKNSAAAWRRALLPQQEVTRAYMDSTMFELIEDDVVENKILASRLALSIIDKAGGQLNDLRLRVQHLERVRELHASDILRPENLSYLLVEQWTRVGLDRQTWTLAQDVIQQQMVESVADAYKHANQFLIGKGILPEIDLKSQIRRSTESAGIGFAKEGIAPTVANNAPASTVTASASATDFSKDTSGLRRPRGHADSTTTRPRAGRATQSSDESSTPVGRARMRAQGLLGQLRRALGDRDVDFAHTQPHGPSAAVVQALNQGGSGNRNGGSVARGTGNAAYVMEDGTYAGNPASVARVAEGLRERTTAIKKQASTTGEKATIEIVALMFQSILAEERIPPTVRVWFARLQMPVMRVALFEPEFFGTLHHPARKLIDHMGSCVLGFDSRAISGSALETEIKRVVQVIEQYPDTGRRVFQLVYDEFQKFLSTFLTGKETSQRVVSLAQQVEQKETLAIQYTIEMRNMLNSMPVREEIREFLFKVWAEVLAVAATKNGPQHDETIMLKRSASDLVWAASAKPNRSERARVIHDLPNLLQRLRHGMALLGLAGEVQERHIKTIGDTLADAFMSKTESIPQDHIDAMAERLDHLEDFVIQDGAGDIPLDAASIEMLVGIDASTIVVVADGGSKPSHAMMSWAQELQPGTWYALDHNGKTTQVQFVWRSERKQLHLFASIEGLSFLIQARRLAAYLQAGLLVPQEEEGLTVRATRDALAKLDANPERLLH